MDTNNDKKFTVVLGASPNPERYSNMAVNRLAAKGHPVVAIGSRAAQIGDIPVITAHPALEQVDTVTVYLNPTIQREYYDYILQLHPKRIIFNPGAENAELADIAREHQIQPVEACTLVLLSTGQF